MVCDWTLILCHGFNKAKPITETKNQRYRTKDKELKKRTLEDKETKTENPKTRQEAKEKVKKETTPRDKKHKFVLVVRLSYFFFNYYYLSKILSVFLKTEKA